MKNFIATVLMVSAFIVSTAPVYAATTLDRDVPLDRDIIEEKVRDEIINLKSLPKEDRAERVTELKDKVKDRLEESDLNPQQKKRFIQRVKDSSNYERKKLGYKNPIIRDQQVRHPKNVSKDRGVIGANVLLAILVFLSVGLSSFLFNNLIEAHGDDLNKFYKRVPLLKQFYTKNATKKHVALRFITLAVVLLLFAVIAAHIDPDFNLLKLENLGVLLITTIVIILSTFTKDFMRFFVALKWKCPALFRPNIIGLFIAVACVALTRHFELSPGYVFGIPMGLFIISRRFEENEGHLEFLGLLLMLGVTILTWWLAPMAEEYQILYDVLTLLYVILLEAVFFELFPLEYLPGKAIYHWNKPAWAILFIVTVFLLFHTIFNPQSTLSTIKDSRPTKITLFIFGAYVIFSILLWAFMTYRSKSKKA
jgi:hypothetical protein